MKEKGGLFKPDFVKKKIIGDAGWSSSLDGGTGEVGLEGSVCALTSSRKRGLSCSSIPVLPDSTLRAATEQRFQCISKEAIWNPGLNLSLLLTNVCACLLAPEPLLQTASAIKLHPSVSARRPLLLTQVDVKKQCNINGRRRLLRASRPPGVT